jgi:hypothetical protein
MVMLGRRDGDDELGAAEEEEGVSASTTSLVVLFDKDLFFANAGIFRREMHEASREIPATPNTSSLTPSRSPTSTSRV